MSHGLGTIVLAFESSAPPNPTAMLSAVLTWLGFAIFSLMASLTVLWRWRVSLFRQPTH